MALRPLPTLLAAAGIALTIVQSAPLHAQSSGGWVPLHLDEGLFPGVRVLVVPSADGLDVYFKNIGSSEVHFSFYLEGIQSPDDVPENGRIHLKPRNLAGPLTLQSPSKAKGAIKVRAFNLNQGEADAPALSAN